MLRSLVGSEMCIRDRVSTQSTGIRELLQMETVRLGLHQIFLYDDYDAHRPTVLPDPDQPTTEQLQALGLPTSFASTGSNGASPAPGKRRRANRSSTVTFSLTEAGQVLKQEALPGFPPSACTWCQEQAENKPMLLHWDVLFDARLSAPSPEQEHVALEWFGSGEASAEVQWKIAWRYHTLCHCVEDQEETADVDDDQEPAAAEAELDPEGGMRPEAALNRYWRQRYRLFSRFDEGIQLDHESWYSVTPEVIALHTAKRCGANRVVVDAFCGSGGNAIAFARMPGCRVLAIDIDIAKIENARLNAQIYGVADRIEFVCADCTQLIPQLRGVDVLFLSPPWGGPEACKGEVFDLTQMKIGEYDGFSLFTMCNACLLYTSDAADEEDSVDLGGRRIIKKKK
eukprot:TRINITY_DN59944_c0_g1_i1.p1 TRINITY_DN59944_c0_g1~~TRINITY_DN59944_c0_g1_i1.p1  ORF type:complete len:399 (+),score=98.59 TRINITY_DN59944_c0_g1_i1:132-1328(+)